MNLSDKPSWINLMIEDMFLSTIRVIFFLLAIGFPMTLIIYDSLLAIHYWSLGIRFVGFELPNWVLIGIVPIDSGISMDLLSNRIINQLTLISIGIWALYMTYKEANRIGTEAQI